MRFRGGKQMLWSLVGTRTNPKSGCYLYDPQAARGAKR